MAKVLDERGYVASERNRQFSPEQVIWARGKVFRRELTAAEIARAWGASPETIRKMVRGDTYGNVGQQLPEASQSVYAKEMRGADERAIEALKASGILDAAHEEEKGDLAKGNDGAVEKFLRGSEGEDDPFRQE